MKRVLISLAVLACFGANAQSSLTGQNDNSAAALNAGNSQTANYYGAAPNPVTYGTLKQEVKGQPSGAVPPAFATPAVQGTCATAGWGVGIQGGVGGVSVAGKGGVDVGCDLDRDLIIMQRLGASQADALRRACMKEEIAASLEACKKPAPAKVSQARMPWQSGG